MSPELDRPRTSPELDSPRTSPELDPPRTSREVDRRAGPDQVMSRYFAAFGGLCEIFAIDLPRSVVDAAVAWTRGQHHRFTRFEPESELSHFNNAPPGQWVTVSEDLEALLRVGLDAYERSDGLVHIGVLPALLAAGYTRTFEEGPTEAAPDRAQPPKPLPELLEVKPGQAKLVKGAAVDLGGIAKGWLADRCVERLGNNALANFGGDLFGHGRGTTGEGWPVGFGNRTVLLHDMGAATSGTIKRSWGEGLHHLIDPRTGLPSTTDLAEMSVLAPTGTDAEIFAKTALLMGSETGIAWLEGKALGWATP